MLWCIFSTRLTAGTAWIFSMMTFQERYRFEIKKYDLDILENYRLLEKMEENVAEKGEDLPVIFIGDSVFYGPDEGREKLAGTIKSLVKTAGPLPRDTIKSPFNTVKKEVGKIHLYYFYQTGCKECNRIEILITVLTRNYKNLKTHSFNIFDNKSKIFFESLGQKNNIPQAQRLIVPTVIIGKDYLIKEEITLKNVEALLKKYKKGSLKFEFTYSEGAEQSIADRFRHFSIFGIIFAGLLDGVNPCAFATLIFFVSYLLFIGRRRRDIVLMAIFFICAVFITYFAIGIGAFNLLKYITGIQIIAKIIFLAFGVIAIVLGILSMRDFALARQGKTNQMLLQLPLGIKQRIHKDIKEKTAMGSIIFGSLIAGFLISLLEFGCTGQIYLPTITFMVSKAGFALKPLLTLLLYNVMFVLPLIIIALLATLLSTKNIARILETKIPTIKLLTALLFFALGILLILIA
jgi:cytochrome c biogenesis protein CcdA